MEEARRVCCCNAVATGGDCCIDQQRCPQLEQLPAAWRVRTSAEYGFFGRWPQWISLTE
jgi:hypothetical protein